MSPLEYTRALALACIERDVAHPLCTEDQRKVLRAMQAVVETHLALLYAEMVRQT